jgi:hypothetical protein
LAARGIEAESIRTYRGGVDPFVKNCKKATVEEVTKQDLIDFMGWLRKQPLQKRKHSNPNRTYFNKVSYVAIFLKEYGVTRLLKKKEYPQFHKKKVVAHTEDELSVLYTHADAEDWFLLDFMIGSMARDCEAYGCRYSDLTGTTLNALRQTAQDSNGGDHAAARRQHQRAAQAQRLRISVSQLQRQAKHAFAPQATEHRQEGEGEVPRRVT